ncbi:hypothetical protein [Demetria terragena]|uniref:hypothetical protein n=1 Tax=Demetria terragena TaxID=63959 RepID=UPI00038136A1|nr:hypothetical protein [Demetria terragena]
MGSLPLAAVPYILLIDDMTRQARDPSAAMLVGGLGAAVIGALGWAVTVALPLRSVRP